MIDRNGRAHSPVGDHDGGQFQAKAKPEPDVALTPSQWISPIQAQMAHDFFNLPESAGFVVSGGAALIASGVVARLSDDLDLFTHPGAGDVTAAAAAIQDLVISRGWTLERIHDNPTFVRMSIVDAAGEELLVDLAMDATPLDPPTVSFLGPTMSLEENAGRKVLALFGRAEPRDFVDTYALHERFTLEKLQQLAAQRDAGFDTSVLRDMIGSLPSIPDEDLPIPAERLEDMRAFFADWARELGAL